MSARPRVVAVVPPVWVDGARELLDPDVEVVAGGASRQESVAAGLAALDSAGPDVVLVHDAARAFTPSRIFDAVEAQVARTGAGVVPALPLVDTIKQTDARQRVRSTVDRSSLRAVQTPQGFPFLQLVAAYASAAQEHTDDAALFAADGRDVHVIEGDPLAFKVTTPDDLDRARSLLPQQTFVGVGVDVHA